MEKVYEVYINPENTRIVLRGCEYDTKWCDVADDIVPIESEIWAEISCTRSRSGYYDESEIGYFNGITDIDNLIGGEIRCSTNINVFLKIQTNKGYCSIEARCIGGDYYGGEIYIDEYNIHYTDALLEKMNMRKITTDF